MDKVNRLIVFFVMPGMIGCAGLQQYQGLIDTGASTGITLALQYGVKDSARRTQVANYSDAIASGIRTVSGNPTPAQLTQILLTFLPSQIRSQYPEIATLVIPLAVSIYQAAYAKYGGNATKVYSILNELAGDIEAGVAPFVSHS